MITGLGLEVVLKGSTLSLSHIGSGSPRLQVTSVSTGEAQEVEVPIARRSNLEGPRRSRGAKSTDTLDKCPNPRP